MGLIRKTASLTTLGVVRMNSKKQRVAKKQLGEMKRQTQALEELARRAKPRRALVTIVDDNLNSSVATAPSHGQSGWHRARGPMMGVASDRA